MDTGLFSSDGWSSPLGRDFCFDTSDFELEAGFDDGDPAEETFCSFGRAFGSAIFGTVPRRPQPMMPLAQLRARWRERLSSLQVHLLLLVQLLLSLPLELQVQMVQKLLLSAVSSEHQPLVVSLDLPSLAEFWEPQQLTVVLELHLLEGAATTCCVHSLAYPTFELHWVAEASLFLGKPVVQRARQLRRPEMRIQISEKILPRRTSQVPEPQLLPRCREQIAPRPHVADRGWSAFQYRQPR